jgi:glycosyltransferase involved in cell wall biosynthesis
MSAAAYVIITPVRNEAEHIEKTIESLVSQTCQPKKWVIVDDGSTDTTPQLIDAAEKEHPWIETVHRPDRGFRKAGEGVIEAFYDGYRLLDGMSWDYLVKLDGDLSFEPSYFSSCFDHFNRDTKLGIGGGTICGLVNGALIEESQGDPPFHVRGATKIYRRACWDAVGGLIMAPGWDGLDEIKANMLGWKTYSFPELKLRHYRFAGNADGAWKNWVKNGLANYVSGYHPVFMLCKCLSRVKDKPYGVVPAGLCYGFLSGYFKRIPRVQDRDLIKYFRDQQMRRLTLRNSLWTKRSN